MASHYILFIVIGIFSLFSEFTIFLVYLPLLSSDFTVLSVSLSEFTLDGVFLAP